MPKQLYDKLLHLLSRNTNRMYPYSDYVYGDTFPEQMTEILNTKVKILYRDYYRSDNRVDDINPSITDINGNKISSRPIDDDGTFIKNHHKEKDPNDIYEGMFLVLRADRVEPNVFIAISEDCKYIVVSSTKLTSDGYYVYEVRPCIYPIQYNEYIGLGCYDQYDGRIEEIKAATLRVDMGEPCQSVLMEFLGSTGYVRFVLGDECYSKLYDYYDITGDRDYDAKSASNDKFPPIDVDGRKANPSTDLSKDINGGYADNWLKLYDKDNIMSNEEIADFRKQILSKGVKIYGTNQNISI